MSEKNPELVTMFAAHCPFRKSGSPVLGNMGSSFKSVIIFEGDEWKKLCDRVPALQTMQFNVGRFE